MRRTITYIFLAALFLIIVFFLNGIQAKVEKQETKKMQKQDMTGDYRKYDAGSFITHLPLVVLDTGGRQIEKESETWAKISVINNESGNNHIDDTPNFMADAVIKYRGNSSYLTFDKKQYRIEFREGQGNKANKRHTLLGMSEGSDWVLNAPFLDRSLVRNRLIYGISRELLSWAPDTRYCEVFLNGQYQGIYLLVETVTNEEGRLNLTDFGLISGRTAYVLKRERSNTEENELESWGSINGKTSHRLSISYPTPKRLTENQRRWIEQDINEFERVLYSDKFDHPEYGYAAYIDVNSFVDYYIINELTLTTDAGYLSTVVYKNIGGKLKTIVWDFNNSFNNYAWEIKASDKFYVSQSNWYNRLFQDKKFTEAVIARYRALRKGILSEGNLLGLVDENVLYLGDAIDRNFTVWGYTFNEPLMSLDEAGNYRDPENHEEAIEQLKSTIIQRGNFMDNNMESLYRHSIN